MFMLWVDIIFSDSSLHEIGLASHTITSFQNFLFLKAKASLCNLPRIKCSSMYLSNTARKCPPPTHSFSCRIVAQIQFLMGWQGCSLLFLYWFFICTQAQQFIYLFRTFVPLCQVNRTSTFFIVIFPTPSWSLQLCKTSPTTCKLSKAQQIPFCVWIFFPCTAPLFLSSSKKGAQLSGSPLLLSLCQELLCFWIAQNLKWRRLGICEGGVLSLQSSHLCAGLGKE